MSNEGWINTMWLFTPHTHTYICTKIYYIMFKYLPIIKNCRSLNKWKRRECHRFCSDISVHKTKSYVSPCQSFETDGGGMRPTSFCVHHANFQRVPPEVTWLLLSLMLVSCGHVRSEDTQSNSDLILLLGQEE